MEVTWIREEDTEENCLPDRRQQNEKKSVKEKQKNQYIQKTFSTENDKD